MDIWHMYDIFIEVRYCYLYGSVKVNFEALHEKFKLALKGHFSLFLKYVIKHNSSSPPHTHILRDSSPQRLRVWLLQSP